MSHQIVFIGAGNVATHLAPELKSKGHKLLQVYSRTVESAHKLAEKLNCLYTTNPEEIVTYADLYIVALNDSSFDDVLSRVDLRNRFIVHLSGSLSIDVLRSYSTSYGVLYPLQTFSKEHKVDFKSIPLFVEGSSKDSEELLISLASELSESVMVLDSGSRLYLHIAAVFACNFTNYFYLQAAEILQAKNISFEKIRPLILETAEKAQTKLPVDIQTGPARRGDRNIIDTHIEALREFPELSRNYQIISESILKKFKE